MALKNLTDAYRPHKAELFGVFCIAILIIFFKMPERILHGFLWAEDTSIFMKGAYEQGPTSFGVAYAGYLHFIPRLIAYGHSLFLTPFSAPYVYAIASTLLTAACSVFIFDITKRYLKRFDFSTTPQSSLFNSLLALLAALSFFLIPHQGEVLLNITNLQWILAPTMLLLLLDLFLVGEESLFFLILKTGILFLMGMTGPFVILFFPCAALLMLGAVKKIKRLSFCLPALTFFLALIIQTATLLLHPSDAKKTLFLNCRASIFDDLCAQLFFVNPPTHSFFGNICITIIFLLILLSAFFSRKRSLTPLILIFTTLEVWCASVIMRPIPLGVTVHIGPRDYNARYYFIPAILLSWALLFCIKLLPSYKKMIPSILLAMLFTTGIIHFRAQRHSLWTITQEKGSYHITAPCYWEATIKKQLPPP